MITTSRQNGFWNLHMTANACEHWPGSLLSTNISVFNISEQKRCIFPWRSFLSPTFFLVGPPGSIRSYRLPLLFHRYHPKECRAKRGSRQAFRSYAGSRIEKSTDIIGRKLFIASCSNQVCIGAIKQYTIERWLIAVADGSEPHESGLQISC